MRGAFNRGVPAARGERGEIFGGPASGLTQAEAQQPQRSAQFLSNAHTHTPTTGLGRGGGSEENNGSRQWPGENGW